MQDGAAAGCVQAQAGADEAFDALLQIGGRASQMGPDMLAWQAQASGQLDPRQHQIGMRLRRVQSAAAQALVAERSGRGDQ